jgi:hypothetical protein
VAAAQPFGMSHGWLSRDSGIQGSGRVVASENGEGLTLSLHYFGIKMRSSTDRNNVRRCIIERMC